VGFQELCDELIVLWKSNQILLSELNLIDTKLFYGTYFSWYDCPEDKSHMAARSCNYPWGMSVGLSPFLVCPCCDKMWYINNDIGTIIRKEEELYLKTLKSWDKTVPRMAKGKVTGALLSKIHNSLGCDPETATFLLKIDFTEELQADYEKEYTKHKTTGKNLLS